MENHFAPLIFLFGHGATTVNNPFAACYNCGACGGRGGGPNARLMARCANDSKVRAILANQHGIKIPDDTHFIGGAHNTTSDAVDLFDLEALPQASQALFCQAKAI